MPIQLAHQLTQAAQVRKEEVDFSAPTPSRRSRSNMSRKAGSRRHSGHLHAAQRKSFADRSPRSGHREGHQARHSRRHVRQSTRKSTSIRRAASSPAVRWAMPASPAARSSSIRTAATAATAAARFPARIPPRWTVRLATWRVTLRRISSRRVSPRKWKSSWPTRSAWPSPCRSWRTPSAPARFRIADHRSGSRVLRAHAQGHHRRARSAPADLPDDRRLRPLRPHRPGIHLGAHRQSRAIRKEAGAVAMARG